MKKTKEEKAIIEITNVKKKNNLDDREWLNVLLNEIADNILLNFCNPKIDNMDQVIDVSDKIILFLKKLIVQKFNKINKFIEENETEEIFSKEFSDFMINKFGAETDIRDLIENPSFYEELMRYSGVSEEKIKELIQDFIEKTANEEYQDNDHTSKI